MLAQVLPRPSLPQPSLKQGTIFGLHVTLSPPLFPVQGLPVRETQNWCFVRAGGFPSLSRLEPAKTASCRWPGARHHPAWARSPTSESPIPGTSRVAAARLPAGEVSLRLTFCSSRLYLQVFVPCCAVGGFQQNVNNCRASACFLSSASPVSSRTLLM